MSDIRNKTLKKTTEVSDPPKNWDSNKENGSLSNFLDQDAGDAYKRQWHRLERGLRLNRLRKFSADEAIRLNLTESEKVALNTLLVKSLEKKLLNSKTSVVYDPENERITEIKGLVMHTNSDGVNLFTLIDKQKGVTFRRKKEL